MYFTKRNATKRYGIEYLKNSLKADRLICFGDNLNDVPLFEAADECYAVSNAQESLKKLATAVIGSNTDDSVARYIQNDFLSALP